MLRKLLITGLLSLCALVGAAQSVKDVRINEILVINESNLVDDYGSRSAWIELYNTSHSVINLGGCYFTVGQGDDAIAYRIPTTDHRTEIAPLGYMMFYCDGVSSKGTFYTNFTLDKSNTLTFLNASYEPLQVVEYALEDQKADVSFGLVTKDDELVWQLTDYTTVMASNETVSEKTGAEKFQERDSTGIVLAITAICVVFSALLALFLLFRLVGYINVKLLGRKTSKSTTVAAAAGLESSQSDEVVAAIALAFKMHQEDLHDKESTILTINRVARAYSPWSSKIYGINQLPNKK